MEGSEQYGRSPGQISYSELSTLSRCEMAWYLRYREGIRGPAPDAMRLGTLVHVGVQAFWRGDDWREYLAKEVAEDGASWEDIVLSSCDEPVPTAVWLMSRYERHYRSMRDRVKVVAQELYLESEILSFEGELLQYIGYIDELWEVDNELYVVEHKTYSRGDRLLTIEVDPQLTNYVWLAKQHGYNVKGAVFDGIYTYRWKNKMPTQAQLIEESDKMFPSKKAATEWAKGELKNHAGVERPDHESFDMRWLDRTDDQIEQSLINVQAFIARRADLANPSLIIRNIGSNCTWCQQKTVCWERMSFPQEIGIEE